MRILTFTTLFPNEASPQHGIFVENRLRHLLASGQVSARVVAPVPWFPFADERFGRYAKFARVPQREVRFGVAIDHPRYPLIPKVGMLPAPALLYQAALRRARALMAEGERFDLIDAHYFYPDGIAAAMLGRTLGLPVTITARGTDVNLIADFALPRRMILWAANRAAGMITVCAALKDRLVEIGVDGSRVTVLRNGVDLSFFRPHPDRAAARAKVGVGTGSGAGLVLLSVGHLITRKAHDLVIQALAELPPDTRLLIAGEGPERDALTALAERLGVAPRVTFLGQRPQSDLPDLYAAADILVLASSREGWANVLLEAMACGTPVAASNVWGTPEVVAEPAAGVLVEPRTGAAFAAGIRRLAAALPDRAATRAYAEKFSWDATTEGQLALFGEILSRSGSNGAARDGEARAA
jgi:glycosyltransferase involved in cell wall biosynthesis